MVEDLIDYEIKQCKRNIIFTNFNKFEAKQIVIIPFSPRLPEDKFIWSAEKNGIYSVKSAYYLIGEAKRRIQAGVSGGKESNF